MGGKIAFKTALQTAAGRAPKDMQSATRRKEYLDAVVKDVFERWKADKANLSNFAKDVFDAAASRNRASCWRSWLRRPSPRSPVLERHPGQRPDGGFTDRRGRRLRGWTRHIRGHDVAEAQGQGEEQPIPVLTLLEKDGVAFSVTA